MIATKMLWRCTNVSPTGAGNGGRTATFNALPPGTTPRDASSAASAGTITLTSTTPELLADFRAGEIYQLTPADAAGG